MTDTPSDRPDSIEFLGLGTDAWQAIGAMATAGAFIIAAVAVLVAFLQLKSAREAAALQLAQDRDATAAQLQQNQAAATGQLEQNRLLAAQQLEQDRLALRDQLAHAAETARDQSRPYVLLSVDVGDQNFAAIDLVLENAGQTAALDVRIQVDPPLMRAREDADSEMKGARIFERPVPMLPPGYRLVSWLDSAIERYERKGQLPDEHRVTIQYNDGRGNEYREESVIDLTLWDGLMFGQRYGLHDAAKALKEIHQLLKKSPVLKGGFEVVVEERQTHTDRVLEERARQRAQHEATVARVEAARQAAAEQADVKSAVKDGQVE
jgi:hypothetical protein